MKYKVLILGEALNEYPHLRERLEETSEILVLENQTSFKDVLSNWHPHAIIVAKKVMPSSLFEMLKVSLKKTQKHERPGLMILAQSYSLEEEKNSFMAHADHYLLIHSPEESIHLRLQSVCERTQLLRDTLTNQKPETSSSRLFALPLDTSLPISAIQSQEIIYEDLKVWPDKRSCHFLNREIRLTPSQFRLLVLFLNHQEVLLTRDVIKKYVWENKEISLRSIDAHIAKLKRRLPILDSALINVYGEGYRLRSPRAKAA